MKGGVNDMVIKNINLETVCGITSVLPENDKPEIAFAGKSNVGKSSLINGLMNRKALARTSAQPGKTQTINFYNINEEMYLVDLPGYGYAQGSSTKSSQRRLEQMIAGYILQRKQLVNLFVLIDIRHEQQRIDREFVDWLGESGVPFCIVFTKSDKLTAGKARANAEQWMHALKDRWESLPPYFITSSSKHEGGEAVLDYIEQCIHMDEAAAEVAAEAAPKDAVNDAAGDVAKNAAEAENATEAE